MSDKKKGFQPPTSSTTGTSGTGATPTGTTGTTGSPSGTSTSASSSSRAAARRSGQTVKVSPEPTSPLEKYRFPIIIGVVVLGILALGAIFLQSATAAPYTCTTLMTPGPVEPAPTPRPAAGAPVASSAPAASIAPAESTTPAASTAPGASPTPAATPEPQPTQRLGFVAQDMGQGHVSETTSITYAYCPPTSGQHFSSKTAPLPRRFYSPSDALRPGNWVHNLEHGYVVILYKGTPDADTQAAIQKIVDEAPGTTFTTESCGLPNKVIAVRFDDMSTPYAAVSWDRALMLETFDAQQLSTFAQQWQESPVWPEQGVC